MTKIEQVQKFLDQKPAPTVRRMFFGVPLDDLLSILTPEQTLKAFEIAIEAARSTGYSKGVVQSANRRLTGIEEWDDMLNQGVPTEALTKF